MTLQELQAEAEGTVSATTRIEIYDKIIERFPGDESADNALLMAGFIYSEEIKDYDIAREYFKRILAEYPGSENIDSAQWMLDNMGKENIEIPENNEE
jgi:outer membrane protein assembly factor BamD (BamD/ComL family)